MYFIYIYKSKLSFYWNYKNLNQDKEILRNAREYRCETFIQLTGVNNDTLLRISVEVRLVFVINDVRITRRAHVYDNFTRYIPQVIHSFLPSWSESLIIACSYGHIITVNIKYIYVYIYILYIYIYIYIYIHTYTQTIYTVFIYYELKFYVFLLYYGFIKKIVIKLQSVISLQRTYNRNKLPIFAYFSTKFIFVRRWIRACRDLYINERNDHATTIAIWLTRRGTLGMATLPPPPSPTTTMMTMLRWTSISHPFV